MRRRTLFAFDSFLFAPSVALTFLLLAPPASGTLGLCAGTWVNVSLSGYPSCSDYVVSTSGSWSAGGGANGVKLEYYINNTKVQEEVKWGTSGSWDFSEDVDCNDFEFDVKAFVRVGSTTCLNHNDSDGDFFEGCLPSASISCIERGAEFYLCSASANGGRSPYSSKEWYEDGSWVSGDWIEILHCEDGNEIKFRLKDAKGCSSNTPSSYCGEEPPWVHGR